MLVLCGLAMSFVFPLVCKRNPCAIIWCVVSVHVNALNRKAFRAFPHIRKKRFKTVKPSFANLYSAPAIRFPVVTLWVAAPGLDSAPGAVLTGLG